MIISKIKNVLITLCAVIIPACSGGNYTPLEVVDNVDIENYFGRWHEIARLPKIDDALLNSLIDKVSQKGFDVSKMVYPDQSCYEQLTNKTN